MAIIDTEEPIEAPSINEKDASNELKVRKAKKKKAKSPTTNTLTTTDTARAGSMTPAPRSSRSQTPLSMYVQRRSEDPTQPIKLRSITPFINRQSKEKTPFELGTDIRSQLISHKMVFDRASYMDISDEAGYAPARYLTSDVAVVDRASVMDVSNVEVVYLIEEYDDAAYEEQLQAQLAEEELARKKKAKKGSRKSRSVTIATSEKDASASPSASVERESPKTKTKTVKKKVIKKKDEDEDEEEEYSPPPVQLPKLKLDLGGGPKFNKKLFEQKSQPPSGPDAKPPPKRAVPSAAQMEEEKKKINQGQKTATSKIIEREKSEVKSDRELSEIPDDDELNFDENLNIEGEEFVEEIEKEPTPEPEPEPEPTEEELALLELQRIEAEKQEKERKRLERKERERIAILRNQMAEIEKWNRLREEEGVEFMNRIKKFLAQKRDDPKNPCFVNHLPNATVMEGKDVRISCSVNGTDLEIMWFKNGREIHPSDKYRFKVNLYDVLSLEILNCRKVDSGEYMCIVANGKRQATSTCFVSVYDEQSWMEEPCPPNIDAVTDSYHYADDVLEIECRSHGTPRPIITWHRDDTELKTNQNYHCLERPHGINTLTIKKPTIRDTGIYEIRAINSVGQHVRKHIVEFFITTEKVLNMSDGI